MEVNYTSRVVLLLYAYNILTFFPRSLQSQQFQIDFTLYTQHCEIPL